MMDIFFDLDGVIIDSRVAIARSVNETLLAYGLPLLQTGEFEPFVGPPIVEGFREILRARGRDASDAAAFVQPFRERYARVARTDTLIVPGITRVIQDLSTVHRLAVVTSKARYLAVPILDAFDLTRWFCAIVGPEREALDESKSQTLARAVALADDGEHRVMIGDRRHDIAAGKIHRCRTIGVAWGIGSREELVAAGADAIVVQPPDLVAAIAS